MQTKFFLAVGYGTLIVDVYLVLASIATRMMNSQYTGYLPPFGPDGAQTSRFMVLLIATWTAILALGCIRSNNPKSAGAPGTIWFVLVLAIVWLGYLTPLLWELFA